MPRPLWRTKEPTVLVTSHDILPDDPLSTRTSSRRAILPQSAQCIRQGAGKVRVSLRSLNPVFLSTTNFLTRYVLPPTLVTSTSSYRTASEVLSAAQDVISTYSTSFVTTVGHSLDAATGY